MEIRDVETFLVLAEELHFGRTARRLYLSAGRVSQTIRQLEKEVGAPLFARSSRQVRMTPVGERFRDAAQHGYDTLVGALREAQRAAKGIDDVLRVGYFRSLGSRRAMELVAAFEGSYPQCQVVLSSVTPGASFYALTRGEVDVVFSWLPYEDPTLLREWGLAVGPTIDTAQRVLLIAEGHPLTELDSLSVDALADLTLSLLDLGLGGPAVYRDAWTPPSTPSGCRLRRTKNNLAALRGRQGIELEDVYMAIARGTAVHLGLHSPMLDSFGVKAIPVHDLPQCVLAPVWRATEETATMRKFIDLVIAVTGGGSGDSQDCIELASALP